MSNAARPSDGRKVTLPQVLALMAIWSAVIYGLAVQRPVEAEQISLKTKAPACACSKGG